MWVIVCVCEPTVTCANPLTANSEFLPIVVLSEKDRLENSILVVSPQRKPLLPALVLMSAEKSAELEPDRVQVVFPEPRTPSTLTINAALAVVEASARRTSVTR